MKFEGEAVREMVALAGGQIVGKTRLQKAGYVLELSGLGYGFDFSYHNFGPYSEELAWAAREAVIDGKVVEREDARWGGTYSIFSTDRQLPKDGTEDARSHLLAKVVKADAVVLELAATAALLHAGGVRDWWTETAKRKPLKAKPDTCRGEGVFGRCFGHLSCPSSCLISISVSK